MRAKGLGFKLALYIVSATILIVGAIIWRNNTVSRHLLLKNVEENAGNLTKSTVNKIEGILETVAKIPENEAYVFENFRLSTEQLEKYLKTVVQNNDEIFGGCIAFEPFTFNVDEKLYCPYYYRSGDSVAFENLDNETYNYLYQDWFQIPKMLDQPIWSEPYFDEGGGNILMCTYSVHFHAFESGKSSFWGIVTIDISLKWLENIIEEIKLFESGYAFLISQNGTIITHPYENFEINETIFSIAENTDNPGLRDIGRDMLAGKSGFVQFTSVIAGEKSYMFYYPLEEAGWSMGVVFPDEELFADLYSLNTRLLTIGIIGVVILLVLIVVTSQRITNPLTRLAKATKAIGQGNFEVPLPEIKSKDEIAELTVSIRRMQSQLKNYIKNLQETTAAKERIESELKIAHDIQQGIIPKIFPPFPEREDVDLYAILDPARDVGGDLYDFFFIDDHKLFFAVGDVSGKGVPASLFMAITRTLLRAKATKDSSVRDIVKSINFELCQGNENSMFVTFFLGMIDLKTGKVEYCNAGHNFPYILRNSCKLECVEKTHGTPLGIFEDIDYQSDFLQLNKEDMIILYTDGVPEAMNINDELYSDERLTGFLKGHCNHSSPETVTRELVKSVKDFTGEAEQSDDITILTLTYFLKK